MLNETIVSARGTARLEVAPDSAELHLQINLVDNDASSARSQVMEKLAELSQGLEQLGATAAVPGDDKVPATYARQRIYVARNQTWNDKTRRYDQSEDYSARASLAVSLRDFTLMNAVARLATEAGANVSGPNWYVDVDNPQWPVVRKQAVRESFIQARDYAEALGGEISGLQHLAEPGLLGTDGGYDNAAAAVRGKRASMGGAGDADNEEVDFTPVPQTLAATVEARYVVRAPDVVAALS